MVFKKKKHEEKVQAATWDDDEPLINPFHGETPETRTFDTGATRDAEKDKPEYGGFFSPAVLRRRAAYMHEHRFMADGSKRASGNWKLGIPLEVYKESLLRHVVEFWSMHEDIKNDLPVDQTAFEDAICAIMFNAEGYLHEVLKEEF